MRLPRRLLSACLLLTAGLLQACSCNDDPGLDARLDGGGGEGLLFPDRPGGSRELRIDFAQSPTDWDGDGLSNEEEALLGTNPWSRDSDGDGKDDLAEVGNPLAPLDSDGDKKIDAVEPSDFDTDGDGLPDQQDPTDLCNGEPRFFVMHTRSSSLTLSKPCSPYRVMGHLWMKGDATLLSVEPGVKVEFGPGAALIIGDSSSRPQLALNGTALEKIHLTALGASPGKGHWRGVVVEQASNLTAAHTLLQWSGGADPSNDPRAAILVKAAQQISLSSVSFAQGAGGGLHAAFYTDPGPLFSAFTGCLFNDLDGPPAVLNIRHLGEIGAGNAFSGAGTAAVVRVHEGIVGKDATWKAVGVPYDFQEKALVVDANLVIEAGVRLILPAEATIDVGHNQSAGSSLAINGTESAPVTLQSAITSQGTWTGLVLSAGANTISHTTIRGAGRVNWQSVKASIYLGPAASLSPTAVTISDGDGFGVYYFRSGEGVCAPVTGSGYLLTGSFPGSDTQPGCKFLCQDDFDAKCVVPAS